MHRQPANALKLLGSLMMLLTFLLPQEGWASKPSVWQIRQQKAVDLLFPH